MKIFIIYLVSAFLLIVGAHIVFRIIVQRDYNKRGKLTFISTLLEFLIWALYFSFPYIYNPSAWPFSWPSFWLFDQEINTALQYLANALIVIGLTLMLTAMAGLGFDRSLGQKVDILNQKGLYGLTRNPQIVSGFPIIIGVALRWPTWYVVGWVLIYLVIAQMMVLTEEEHLHSVHGEVYESYCTFVPRYFGLVSREGGMLH